MRGPHVIDRYYNSDAKAADANGSWFDTGEREGLVIREVHEPCPHSCTRKGAWAGQ